MEAIYFFETSVDVQRITRLNLIFSFVERRETPLGALAPTGHIKPAPDSR
jgi:hypothetical protein